MKNKAFSLAEILIATMFMGIIASLTIPSTINSLKYREHVTAYKNAFQKVKEVTSNSNITDKSEQGVEKFWAQLNDALPVIGYSVSGIKSTGIIEKVAEVVPMNASTLAERATWSHLHEGSSMTIGSKTGSMVTSNQSWSPWIITENGVAFAVRSTAVHDIPNSTDPLHSTTCGTVSNIFHAKPDSRYNTTNMGAMLSCVVLLIDVNGLDKGPNTYPDYQVMTEGEAYEQIRDKDRFHIFVGLDGVSAGPEGVVTYHIMKGH